MLDFTAIAIGSGAPAGCTRCSVPVPAGYFAADDLAASIAAAAVASAAAVPGPNLALTGPEPFGHPELPALVAACVRVGAERIALETDGGALATGGNAAGVIHAGVRHLWVRVLAGEPATSDELSGRRGLAAAARTGVAAYLAAADDAGVTVAVTCSVPVCMHTLPSLPRTAALLAGWGVHALRLHAAGALPAHAGDLLAAACDTGMVNGLWVEVDRSLPLPESHRLHSLVCRAPGGAQ